MEKSLKVCFLILFLSVSALAGSGDAFFQPGNQIPLHEAGDADDNGVVDENDILAVRKQLLGLSSAPGDPDSNGDGVIDVADVISIHLYIFNPPKIVVQPADGVSLVFRKIPAGAFSMGSSEPGWATSFEQPVHNVTIGYIFYMGQTEVTKKQWNAVMGIDPPSAETENQPVEHVSWNECQTFIDNLNALSDYTFRLPTEAEWEYACRASTSARFSFGDSDCEANACTDCNLSNYAWWCGNNSPLGVKNVAQKLPNAFGLYDMHGNVFEWCRDYWHFDYSGAPDDGGAWMTPESQQRVLRGGYWDASPWECSSSSRAFNYPDGKDKQSGLRLILER